MPHVILIFALIILQSGQKQEMSSATFLLHRAAIRGETPSVEMMINLGADVNAPDQQGRTPLHDACLKGHVDTAKLLLDRGAKIAARDENGATPLHDAALGGSSKTIDLLLVRKADIGALDAKGATPLDYALKMERADAVQALRSALSKVEKQK